MVLLCQVARRRDECPEHEELVKVRRSLHQGEELRRVEVVRNPYIFNFFDQVSEESGSIEYNGEPQTCYLDAELVAFLARSDVYDTLAFRSIDDACVEEVFEMHLANVSLSRLLGEIGQRDRKQRLPLSRILELQVGGLTMAIVSTPSSFWVSLCRT